MLMRTSIIRKVARVVLNDANQMLTRKGDSHHAGHKSNPKLRIPSSETLSFAD